MTCQLGIYDHRDDAIDQWNALIHLRDSRPPRNLLREIAPFLREFHVQQDMRDTESLGAWLIWYLIDSSLAAANELGHIAVSREVRSDIDYFYKVSPGLVEVFRIDELLEWQRIAAAEITPESVELGIL